MFTQQYDNSGTGNMFTQAVKLLISFREPPDLNLGLHTEYSDRDFSRFFLNSHLQIEQYLKLGRYPLTHLCNLLLSIVLPLNFEPEVLKFWDIRN
jgi:hypothetical protein